jgi:hypothetical protein
MEKLSMFGDDLYALIDAMPFEWCAVALDKAATIAKHGFSDSGKFFTFAYKLLVEKLQGWLEQENNYGRLFIDQQEHNLLAGAKHDLIAEGHRSLRRAGSGWQQIDRIIERPYFHNSLDSHHTQLADVLAYNVYRRYTRNEPEYPYFVKILSKVRGKIRPDGTYYGLKIYP